MKDSLTGRLMERGRDLFSEENAGLRSLVLVGMGIAAVNATMEESACRGLDMLRTSPDPRVRAAYWGGFLLTAGHVTRAIPNRYDPLSHMGSLLARGGKWRNR